MFGPSTWAWQMSGCAGLWSRRRHVKPRVRYYKNTLKLQNNVISSRATHTQALPVRPSSTPFEFTHRHIHPHTLTHTYTYTHTPSLLQFFHSLPFLAQYRLGPKYRLNLRLSQHRLWQLGSCDGPAHAHHSLYTTCPNSPMFNIQQQEITRKMH